MQASSAPALIIHAYRDTQLPKDLLGLLPIRTGAADPTGGAGETHDCYSVLRMTRLRQIVAVNGMSRVHDFVAEDLVSPFDQILPVWCTDEMHRCVGWPADGLVFAGLAAS